MKTPTPPTPEERRRLQEIAFNLAGNAAEIGFDAAVEFTRNQPAEQHDACGHCGRVLGLPPVEPTQCPETGWDTHPEETKPTVSIFEKVRLLEREVEKLRADNIMLRMEKAALKGDHAEAEKRIAVLESRLDDRVKQIAGLERNNKELREIGATGGPLRNLECDYQNLKDFARARIAELEKELAGYKQRHDELSRAFYDETDGPAVKDNHADWIRQSKRLRKSFNESVGAMLAEEENLIDSYAKPPVNPFPRQR